MKSLGVCVITKNEAANIERCLNSIPCAAQKVVIDSCSTDQTNELAKNAGATVIVRPWPGYSAQKQFALDLMVTDWIIPIDGDESLSREAYQEILKIIEQDDKRFNAYRIVGRNFFLGKLLSVGKGLDHSIRLVRKNTGKYDSRSIHETLHVEGDIADLKNHIIHNSTPTISERMQKIVEHTEAEMEYVPDIPITWNDIFVTPIRYFCGYFFKYRTWRDGIPGIIWLALFAFQTFYRNAKFYEKQLSKKATY